MIYVENFFISKSKHEGSIIKPLPPYKVDYEISDEIIEYLKKNTQEGGIENLWYHKISTYGNVNDIPSPLRELVIQFLPRFIAQYPQYKDEPSIQVKVD